MTHLDLLPTDSVLRRHALTERNRILGLPPTDSVLRRHYEQLQAASLASVAVPPVRPAAVVDTRPAGRDDRAGLLHSVGAAHWRIAFGEDALAGGIPGCNSNGPDRNESR